MAWTNTYMGPRTTDIDMKINMNMDLDMERDMILIWI
jgi:hypothetical protein